MPNQELTGRRTRVLVADDDKVITDTLKAVLDQHGFDTSTAYSGRSAIEAARLCNPQIFLSDVVMPDMNGIEAAIRISTALPKCKVLLFSGQAVSSELLYKAFVWGHEFEVLPKPIHPLQLIARLRSPTLGIPNAEAEIGHPQFPGEFEQVG